MNPLRSRAARVQSRKGLASAPAPLDAIGPLPQPGDYAAFLRDTLPQQRGGIASYPFGSERVWVKKAGLRHGKARYRLMSVCARLLRLDVLTPVPNPGGSEAIAIEARRLADLGAAGLRVPIVLAQQHDGLLLSDLGQSGRASTMLQDRLEHAANTSPTALLASWREGLAAIAAVHACGTYLSQAFARNLVMCPDGVIGYIDFEDDPGQTLTLAECQARDWLSYLHSTAALVDAASPHTAGAHWRAALTIASDAVRQRLALAAKHMRWLKHLPASRRFGRDTQRVRAVARLLERWHDTGR
jgi:hypothetical protein